MLVGDKGLMITYGSGRLREGGRIGWLGCCEKGKKCTSVEVCMYLLYFFASTSYILL